MKDEQGLLSFFRSMPDYWKLIYIGIIIISAACIASSGCASSQKGTTIPTYDQAKKEVLARGPLVKPPVEQQYTFIQGGQAAGVVKDGEVEIVDPKDHTQTKKVKWGAVVIDEKKAAEMRAVKVQRDLLLKKLEAERLRRETEKIIYDAALQKAKEAAKRTWWEKNGPAVGLAVGGTLGAALIIGIVYALTKGNGVTVNTNAHVLQGAMR